MDDLKSRLVAARKAKGIPQRKVAAALDIDVGTVSRWEQGDSVPDATRLAQLAGLYGVQTSDLAPAVDPVADTDRPSNAA